MDSLSRSLITLENPFNTTDEVLAWIQQRNREVHVEVEQVPFAALKGWHFNESTGDLQHDSGRFFSIVGLDVYTNTGCVNHWRQPIINQPEVGYLGILCKEFEGILYFLLQAKIEPGNVNCVQLSPTLQATRSNYMQVHGGRKPAYLDYFRNVRAGQIIIDQLQSEQGARFLRKRNRNIIVRVDDDIELGEDFRWLTLAQIKQLLTHDNIVNMDTRTVLSGLRFANSTDCVSDFGQQLSASEACMNGINTIDEILHGLSELKTRYELVTEKVPLKDVREWMVTDTEIVRPDRLFFRVLGVNVAIDNREVAKWSQPIVQPMQEGLSVLFARQFGGVLHFLLQARVECGNFDVIEFAPTIQCLTGPHKSPIGYVPKFLAEYQSGECVREVLFDTRQSEEGGRFYHEQNHNVVCLVNEVVPEIPPENFFWLTLGQIKEFLRFNNYLNIQVRSLISALNYV